MRRGKVDLSNFFISQMFVYSSTSQPAQQETEKNTLMMLAFGPQKIQEKATTFTTSKRAAATMGSLLFLLTASCLLLENSTVDAFNKLPLPPQSSSSSSTTTTTTRGGGYAGVAHQFSNVEDGLCSTSSRSRSSRRYATIADETTDSSSSSSSSEAGSSSSSSSSMLETIMLEQLKNVAINAKEYADMFGLSYSDAGFYAIFDSIRQSGISLGLKGQPFVLRNVDICNSLQEIRMEESKSESENEQSSPFANFFTIDDLAKATEDDFLDAARGSTDNRKGWKVRLCLPFYAS